MFRRRLLRGLISPAPRSATELIETATVISEITTVPTSEDLGSSNPLTTPKPDILFGLVRHSFIEVCQVLFGEWQHNGQLLSEP